MRLDVRFKEDSNIFVCIDRTKHEGVCRVWAGSGVGSGWVLGGIWGVLWALGVVPDDACCVLGLRTRKSAVRFVGFRKKYLYLRTARLL